MRDDLFEWRRQREGWGTAFEDECHVDNFAGGGGVGMGFEQATGRCFDAAINHDADAIEMHEVNHPGTRHYCEGVFDVNPLEVAAGRPVGLAWFSPDCKDFSRAKGDVPVDKGIRGLAWVAIKWARILADKLRCIILENVREFQDWGPLLNKVENGQHVKHFCKRRGFWVPTMVPDPERRGVTFKRFVRALRKLGYVVEWKVLNCADYGAPTHRRRLFLIARRDGRPIVWPTPTHGPKGDLPYRTAAECIDWSLPCRSIFGRKRPLAEKTCRRIAMGIIRYVVTAARPFVVTINHGGDHFRGRGVDRPAATITGSRGEYLVAPTLAQTGYGERPGQAPRALDLQQPLGTVVAGGGKAALVEAFIAKHYGGVVGHTPERPLGTVTAKDHHSVVEAFILRHCQNGSNGDNTNPVDKPLTTIVSKAEHSVVSATLVGVGGAEYSAKPKPVDEPKSTVLPNDRQALAAAAMVRMNFGDKQWNSVGDPLPTITAQGNKAGLVLAFLQKYYSTGGQLAAADEPSPTQTSKARLGLVTVTLGDGQQGVLVNVPGQGEYVIVDIGLRMLSPRELARCQGFPDSYVLTGSIENQIARIGNSVPPQVVAALVRANLPELCTQPQHVAG